MAEPKLVIDGREYEIPSDPAKIPLGDARAIKQITGLSIARFYGQLASDPTDGDCLTAFIYVVMRRENPGLTVEDVERLSFGSIEWVSGEADASPPVATSPPSSQEGSASPAGSAAAEPTQTPS
jgi:hypothetical protein